VLPDRITAEKLPDRRKLGAAEKAWSCRGSWELHRTGRRYRAAERQPQLKSLRSRRAAEVGAEGVATVGTKGAAAVGAEGGATTVGTTEERKEQPEGCRSSHFVELIHSSNQTQALSCQIAELLPEGATSTCRSKREGEGTVKSEVPRSDRSCSILLRLETTR
jgi:hypothetical protein